MVEIVSLGGKFASLAKPDFFRQKMHWRMNILVSITMQITIFWLKMD